MHREVEGDEDKQGCDEGSSSSSSPSCKVRDRKRRKRGEGEVGDGQQAARHARKPERGKVVPDRRVDGQVGSERKEDGKSDRQAEQDREPAVPAGQNGEAKEREQREQPAEVDELLASRRVPTVDEVDPFGRIAAHFAQRAPAVFRRAGDQRVANEDADPPRREGADHGPDKGEAVEANRCVGEHQRHRPEGEVELPGERDRDE